MRRQRETLADGPLTATVDLSTPIAADTFARAAFVETFWQAGAQRVRSIHGDAAVSAGVPRKRLRQVHRARASRAPDGPRVARMTGSLPRQYSGWSTANTARCCSTRPITLVLIERHSALGPEFGASKRGLSHPRYQGRATEVLDVRAQIAAIGVLPLPIMHRSLLIRMERATRNLRRFDESDLDDVNIAYAMALVWARGVKLDPDPKLLDELRNRPADNWRPLIAIADSFGRKWGAAARKAAVEFARTHTDEDAGVTLLKDIYTIFRAHRVDRLASVALVATGRAG